MSKILPSSPPVRVGQRHISPQRSEYSLDLNALDLETQSNTSEAPAVQQVDQILSENIEGPSDFTQNMEMWMRDGPVSKEPVVLEVDDQFSSEWDMNGQSSTPAPKSSRLLQPSVEDYHSELNLENQKPVAVHRNPSFVETTQLPTAPNQTQPTTAPSERQESQNASDANLMRRLDLLQERCAQLETTNATLREALIKEQNERRTDAVAHHNAMAEAHQREKDLAAAGNAASDKIDHLKQKLGSANEQLENHKKQLETGMNPAKDSNALQKRIDDMNAAQRIHEQAVKTLRQDLASTRQVRDESENQANTLREELSEQRELHETTSERLRIGQEQARQDELAIAGLEQQLAAIKAETDRLKESSKNSETVMNTLRREIETAKESHSDQLSRTMGDHIRAVELATSLQRQVQELRQELRDSRSAKAGAEPVGSPANEQESEAAHRELFALRSDLDAKHIRLNEAILERDALQDSLRESQLEFENLQAALAEHKAVNAVFDGRVSEELHRREKYWQEKLAMAESELHLMATALMHQWGKEEVGVGKPQGYAYKYLQQHGITPGKVKSRAGAP